MMTVAYPQKYLIDVEHWQKMADTAFFSPNSPRLELMNGEILEMPPIGFNHAGLDNGRKIIKKSYLKIGMLFKKQGSIIKLNR